MPKPPKVVRPLSSNKYKVTKATEATEARVQSTSGYTCERANCGHGSVAFLQGQHVCAKHKPKGDPNCSHSLGLPCAYCGAEEAA